MKASAFALPSGETKALAISTIRKLLLEQGVKDYVANENCRTNREEIIASE
jgi:hypothetical protein